MQQDTQTVLETSLRCACKHARFENQKTSIEGRLVTDWCHSRRWHVSVEGKGHTHFIQNRLIPIIVNML